MKKDLQKKIEIPEGVEISLEEGMMTVKGKEGENKRRFKTGKIILEKKDSELILKCGGATKKEKKMMNTILAHIKNLIEGIQKKFEYRLKICSSHFPITVDIQGDEAIIKNFLGEKMPRKLKIPEGVEIKKDKEIIKVMSHNKELAGQTAADFERVTKIRMRDRRVFQDGIYIINKPGGSI